MATTNMQGIFGQSSGMQESPRRPDISGGNFKAWYTDLLQHFKDEMWWNIFWSLTWGIWLLRNDWLFERKKPSIENTILKAMSWVGEYEKANEVTTKLQQIENSSTKWLAPSQGVYKINSDMALLGNNLMGLGDVVRDWVGDVVLSSCWKVNEAISVEESEAMAVRHALTIAWEAGFREVIVEADCLKVIHHLKNKIQEPSTFGCIIADILAIAEQCNSFCFSHVRRTGNIVAHNLAKLSRFYDQMMVWVEDIPTQLHSFVLQDMASV
ncbi:hypothetical protein RDABS01_013754 [Bienertia sinuspersici]